jgi:DNA-binding MarR family transcriptional regulator
MAMKASSPANKMDKASIMDIDRLIHEPARLMIMAHLFMVEKADFIYLMRQTGLTWGNLSAHLTKLEEGGYVNVDKGYKGRKPNTMLQLTPKGREAFQVYTERMKSMLNAVPG